MRYLHAGSFFIFAFLFFTSFSAHVVHAQTPGAAGITLVPASIEKAADPGDTIKETLVITNENDEEKQYYLYKKDIKGVEGGGVPVFAEEGLAPTGYELSSWVHFDDLSGDTITIPPHGKISIPITIQVPDNASPGSHFGGVFASVEAPKLRENGAGVGYEVASIISLRISGDIIDEARIRSFSTDKLIYGSKNVKFSARIENQGNILIRPRGPLTIKNMFGGDDKVIIVNDTAAGVFPESIRDLNFDWKEDSLGFGRYEAILALSYDGDKGIKTITASLYFWVLPTKIIVPVALGFIVIVFGGWFFTRFYVNRAVMRAAGGRRIVPARYRRQVGISRFAFVLISLMGVLVLFLIVLLVFSA